MPLRILLVEDDPASLEFMSVVLASQNLEVRAVTDGQQAASLIAAQRFDGIFLDLQTPSLDGFELLRLVRQSPLNRTAPVAIITGREDRDTMDRVFAEKATFFLHKPIGRARLLALLRTALGQMQQHGRTE